MVELDVQDEIDEMLYIDNIDYFQGRDILRIILYVVNEEIEEMVDVVDMDVVDKDELDESDEIELIDEI